MTTVAAGFPYEKPANNNNIKITSNALSSTAAAASTPTHHDSKSPLNYGEHQNILDAKSLFYGSSSANLYQHQPTQSNFVAAAIAATAINNVNNNFNSYSSYSSSSTSPSAVYSNLSATTTISPLSSD